MKNRGNSGEDSARGPMSKRVTVPSVQSEEASHGLSLAGRTLLSIEGTRLHGKLSFLFPNVIYIICNIIVLYNFEEKS